MNTAEKLSNNGECSDVVNENYRPTESEEQVLKVFKIEREETGENRLNPYYIRQETDLGKGGVNTALSNLRAAGWVVRVTRGLYEFVDDPRDTERAEAGEIRSQPVEPAETPRPDATPDTEEIEGLRAEMEQKLASLDVTGRPAEVEETRREAIKWAWEKLREEGEMQAKVLADEVFHEFEDDPNLGYSASSSRYDGYQLWDSCVREVLRELPGVYPGSGSAKWSFREE